MNIDINCDMGESFGPWTMGADERGHAAHHLGEHRLRRARRGSDGDAAHRAAGARGAAWRSARIRVSPTCRDSAAARSKVDPAELEDSLIAQIGALTAIARAEGVPLQHVKAHGALYNMAARDRRLADAIARAVKACDRR